MSGFRLGLSCGLVSCRFIMLCVHVLHNLCIMLGSSLIFLAFLLYDDGKEEFIIFIVSQHDRHAMFVPA